MDSHSHVKRVADKALHVFWNLVADEFPQAMGGDLSPERSIALSEAAESAVAEWINNNVPQS